MPQSGGSGNTGFKGQFVRQTGNQIIFDSGLLLDSTGAMVTTGTTNLYIYEVQNDGTYLSYDFSSNTLKSTALTTEVQACTHQKGNNATTNTGRWTFALSTLTGFTVGAVYRARFNNTNAYPADRFVDFQYGSGEGDFIVTANGTGAGCLQTDPQKWLSGTIPAVNVTGVPKVDVVDWLGTAPNSLNAGKVDSSTSIRSATGQTGSTSSTIKLDASASATDNLYNDAIVLITGGTGAGQVRSIQSYVGSTKVATIFPNWTTTPDNSSTFTIVPMGQVDVGNWLNGSVAAVNVTGVPKVDLVDINGVAASSTSSVDSNIISVLGTAVTDATANGVMDVALTSKGVDNIVAETGLNLRQAIAIIAAACSGHLSGNTTATVTIDAANNTGTHRIVATIDANDNRTAVTITPPA